MADSISAGHWWLKYSKKVQTTINSQNFTSRLHSMKQLFNLWNENEVKKNLEQYGLLDYNPLLLQGFDVNKTTERLKFADYVVKAWLSKVENISLDVYLGFNTTQDLDNFMVNRSGMPRYKDRKVVAGEWFYLCFTISFVLNAFFTRRAAERTRGAWGKILFGAPMTSLFSNNKTKNPVNRTPKR